MAEVYPLKEIPRSGSSGCSIVEFTNDDYFSASTLPIALPQVWDEIPDGQSIAARTQVFSSNELYICIDRHNKGSVRPESDLTNWIRPARSVERLVNSDGTTTVIDSEGFVGLRFNFVANGTVTTGTTITEASGLGTITYNLNTSGLGGGGQSAQQVRDAIDAAVDAQGDGLQATGDGIIAVGNPIFHTSVLLSGQITNDSSTLTLAGYSDPIEYSWEGTTYVRIFADDGSDERLYRGTDFTDRVYTKTY